MPTALGTIASSYKVSAVLPIPATGLAGWWDADDAATITASAGAVSQWRDKSGNNRHANQATTAEKPTTGTATANGHNVLVFDGGDALSTTGSTGVNIGTATVFIVAKETVSVDFAGLLAAYSPGQTDYVSTTGFALQTVQGGSGVFSVDRQNKPARITGNKPTPFAIYTALFTADLVEPYQNGVLGTPSVIYTDTWGVATGGWVFGGRYLGSLAATNRLNGQIAEVIVYDRALTAPERAEVQNYLGAKWGIYISPIPISGLVGWWDADDASTFTLVSGSNVEQWRDKSPTAAIGLGTAGGYQPTRVDGAQNGRAGVSFNGSTHSLAVAGLSSAHKPFTVAAAIKVTSYDYRAILGPLNTSGPLQWRVSPGRNQEILRAGTSMIGGSTGLLPAAGASVPICTYSAAGDYAFFIDGVAAGSGTSDQVFGADGTNIGVQNSGAERFYGFMFELIKYDRVLSTVERQQVESYLKNKWGTP